MGRFFFHLSVVAVMQILIHVDDLYTFSCLTHSSFIFLVTENEINTSYVYILSFLKYAREMCLMVCLI